MSTRSDRPANINFRAVRALNQALRPVNKGIENDPYLEHTSKFWLDCMDRVTKQVAGQFNMTPEQLMIHAHHASFYNDDCYTNN